MPFFCFLQENLGFSIKLTKEIGYHKVVLKVTMIIMMKMVTTRITIMTTVTIMMKVSPVHALFLSCAEGGEVSRSETSSLDPDKGNKDKESKVL